MKYLYKLTYTVFCIINFFAISSYFEHITDFDTIITYFFSAIISFLPVFSNIIASLGASHAWGWSIPKTALVFIAMPLFTIWLYWLIHLISSRHKK